MSIRGRSTAATAASFVAAAALALLLSGCGPAGGAEGDRDPASAWAMSAEQQASEFADYYQQDIEWVECSEEEGLDDYLADELDAAGFDLDGIACAYIAAPFDWQDPANEESIELSIVHIPSTGEGEPLGTLLANPGGPGEPGVGFMLGMALAPGFDEVAAHYDLLGFDPRGIGGSTPIDCDGGGSRLPVVQLGTCIAENPLTHTMGTSQAARDMELMRALMGDERLNLLGYSYGTMLGATYASLFPENVGRMVLDSAENAEWASLIHNFDQKVAQANAAIALATACTTEYAGQVESCPFVDEETLLGVIAELDESPLIASDGTGITGAMLRDHLIDALYESHFERGRTLDTVALALFGDQEAIDEIAAGSGGGGVEMGITVVTCHSFPIEPDIPGLLAHIEETGMPRLFGGPDIDDTTLAPFIDLSCYALPESGLDFTESFGAPGAGPILVIGITGDHATPFQYAQVLADELGDARLLTFDGQGHAASYFERSSCIDAATTAYLLTGELPAEGTVCTGD